MMKMVKFMSLLVTLVTLVLNELSLIKAFDLEWLINVDECGVTKGCFRIPDNCKNNTDCSYFLTWQNVSSNEIHFEYAATFANHSTPPWAGFGIADEPGMPGATVVDCIANSTGGVRLQMSHNVDKPVHNNQRLNNTYLGLVKSSLEGAVIDSHIFCNFTRLRVLTTPDPESEKVKNLTSPYYVLFATGATKDGEKCMHDFNGIDPHVSNMMIDFNQYSNISGVTEKNAYVRAHATLMIFAWIVLASLGMFTSRYMKNQWNDSGTVCGKPGWFQAHRYAMALVAVLTLAGMLVIFAYNDWQFIAPNVKDGVTTIHPTLGITVGALILVNLIVGVLRPNIYSPYRNYFWFFHTFFGHTSHLLAAVTMFLGVMQHKALMPDWTKWVVVGFACWRILADIVMTATRIRYREHPMNYVAMANNEVDEPATKVAAWRCAVMIVYSIGVVLLALTLIVAANVPL